MAEQNQKQSETEEQATQETAQAASGEAPPEGAAAADAAAADAAAAGAEAADAAAADAGSEAGAAGGGETTGEGADDNGAEDPDLEETIAKLQEDVAAARDAALRAQADAQNVKRRAEQDVERARKFALEGFSKELLPVVDNLERALEAAVGDDEAIKPIAEGVELTLKSFISAMSRFNLEQVDPQGEPFDPKLHQAMSMVDNPDVEPNTVIAVMQKGYVLNGRLVRPAMVMVSKSGD